jgi:hypothetical protein
MAKGISMVNIVEELFQKLRGKKITIYRSDQIPPDDLSPNAIVGIGVLKEVPDSRTGMVSYKLADHNGKDTVFTAYVPHWVIPEEKSVIFLVRAIFS